jgi:hypothetical protein
MNLSAFNNSEMRSRYPEHLPINDVPAIASRIGLMVTIVLHESPLVAPTLHNLSKR